MKIAVAGSVGRDHLMTFPGKFSDSLVAGSIDKVSVSFLVDKLDIRRGGCGANISFGLGALGLNPLLIAAVGKDWQEYDQWLTTHGVLTKHVKQSTELYTATFMVTTDEELNQIASFFPGAMGEANEISLAQIIDDAGVIDLLIISPDDPQAMLNYSEYCRVNSIAFAADPSQQLARMSGEDIKKLIQGATYLFLNEYELALTLQKTGWSDEELFNQVKIRVITTGSNGCIIQTHDAPSITVGVPQELSKIDPTGIGDSFRAGFLAGLSWNVSLERCAQVGSLLATYCLESKGTQEYTFSCEEFLTRFETAYGADATNEIKDSLNPVFDKILARN